jgi:hypothetical protein
LLGNILKPFLAGKGAEVPNLNLDLNFFDHPKTRRLVGLLGRGSEVLPIKLWAYAGKVRAEDGRLIGHAAQEIESIAGWWGKPGEMLEVMLRDGTRFLEQEEDGTYILHDWLEYQGHLAAYKIRAKKANDARWGKLAGVPVKAENATSIPQASHKESPKPAVLTKPTKPTAARTADPPGFVRFWDGWPPNVTGKYERKINRTGCLKRWISLELEAKADAIVDAVQRCKQYHTGWARGYAPLPMTFLNQSQWESAPKPPTEDYFVEDN